MEIKLSDEEIDELETAYLPEINPKVEAMRIYRRSRIRQVIDRISWERSRFMEEEDGADSETALASRDLHTLFEELGRLYYFRAYR